MRAVEARAELATDPAWKALLLIHLAELAVKGEIYQRAYDLLDAASALEGPARFLTRIALEAAATKGESDETLARALEGQADLIAEAIDDPQAGDAAGVPHFRRTPAYAADAWLRAAEIRRKLGDASGCASLLGRAAETLPESIVLAHARMVALELAGDAEAAAALAKREIERGVTGPGAAALWLRVAEAAVLGSDRDTALAALRAALRADSECAPARALEIDLLGDGQDPAALATALETLAETFTTDEAKGRAYLIAAYVWACLGGDAPAAKVALSHAGAAGVPPGAVSRIARTLAAVRGDGSWYEESTERLLAVGADPGEHASLWFELGRSRLLRGDEAGATEAFAKLASVDASSAWLGRVFGAYAVGLK